MSSMSTQTDTLPTFKVVYHLEFCIGRQKNLKKKKKQILLRTY